MFSTAMPTPSLSFLLQPVLSEPHLLTFNNSALVAASSFSDFRWGDRALYLRPWGMGPDNNLVYLNGNRSTLAFGGVKLGSQKRI